MGDIRFTIRAPNVQTLIKAGQIAYIFTMTTFGSYMGIRELPADDNEIVFPATVGAAAGAVVSAASVIAPKPAFAFLTFCGIVFTSSRHELYRRHAVKK